MPVTFDSVAISSAVLPALTDMAAREPTTAPAARDTPLRELPTPSIFPPTCLNCSERALRFTFPTSRSCDLNVFSWLSVSMIWRSSLLYSSELLETFAASICCCCCFRAFSLSFVESIFWFRSSCFCLQSSTLVGLNFSALFTLVSSFVAFASSELTVRIAFCSGVVFPLNSIVIPLIVSAISYPRLYAETSSGVASLYFVVLDLRSSASLPFFWRSLNATVKSTISPMVMCSMSFLVRPRSIPPRNTVSSVISSLLSFLSFSPAAALTLYLSLPLSASPSFLSRPLP